MEILQVHIRGFRGIRSGAVDCSGDTALVGPNNCGKTTILDALALVLGRERIVRHLSEHDFWGSSPTPDSRFHVVVTVGGFDGEEPDAHPDWFRDGRAVHKWYDPAAKAVAAEKRHDACRLCAQIALSGRFDYETLSVETSRYFFDGDTAAEIPDPFADEMVCPVPGVLLSEVGFFLAPPLRTWDRVLSFGSEVFRRFVADLGGLPTDVLLAERDRLRRPEQAVDAAGAMAQVTERINEALTAILPNAPRFTLRVTQTDSESLLQSLIPHYADADSLLPVHRHGTGILALQTLLLLMEFGRARKESGRSFILGVEEPELHLAPGVQGSVIRRAQSAATQVIATTHSPRVAAFFDAHRVVVIENPAGTLRASPLLPEPLNAAAGNWARKLFIDNRQQTVEAMMHPVVIIPEGRLDYQWLTRLGDLMASCGETDACPFPSTVGVVPTHDSAVLETWQRLSAVRSGMCVLLDGDAGGDAHLQRLRQADPACPCVLCWSAGCTVEDMVVWILQGNPDGAPAALSAALGREFPSLADFQTSLHRLSRDGGMKDDLILHEDIVAVIRSDERYVERAKTLLASLCAAASGRDSERWVRDDAAGVTRISRWSPP